LLVEPNMRAPLYRPCGVVAMAALIAAGCSTAPEVRRPRTLTAGLVDEINAAANGRDIEVDLAGIDWKRTAVADSLTFVGPASVRVDPAPFADKPSHPSCQLKEVRVERGSHAGRGALIGIGFMALTVLMLAYDDRPQQKDQMPLALAAPIMLVMGAGGGALLGLPVPKGPIVYPIKQAAVDPDEDCR
jgi:hypothetical protein